jgi:DNA (cytosine-5)-methyltransferase 1
VREAARLHSYPDWFRFHVTKWHGFRQIGNSVPPLLARAVASKISVAFSTAKKPDCSISQGDPRLLSFGMSEAARHYGVRADVVPKRTRTVGRGGANG